MPIPERLVTPMILACRQAGTIGRRRSRPIQSGSRLKQLANSDQLQLSGCFETQRGLASTVSVVSPIFEGEWIEIFGLFLAQRILRTVDVDFSANSEIARTIPAHVQNHWRSKRRGEESRHL